MELLRLENPGSNTTHSETQPPATSSRHKNPTATRSAPSTTSSSSRVNIIHRCALQKGHFTSQVTQPSAVLHPFSSFKELKQEELHAQLQLTILETLLQGNLLHNLGSIWSTPCSCTSKKLSNMLQLKDSYTHTHTHVHPCTHTHTHTQPSYLTFVYASRRIWKHVFNNSPNSESFLDPSSQMLHPIHVPDRELPRMTTGNQVYVEVKPALMIFQLKTDQICTRHTDI